MYVLKHGKTQIEATIALFGDLLVPWVLCGNTVSFSMLLMFWMYKLV